MGILDYPPISHPTKVNCHIIMHYKSIKSLYYLITKINWKMHMNCHTSFSCYKFWLWAHIQLFLKIIYVSRWRANLESSDFLQLSSKFTSYMNFCHYILHPALKIEHLTWISIIYLKYANPCRVVYKPCFSFVIPKCLLKVAGLDKSK